MTRRFTTRLAGVLVLSAATIVLPGGHTPAQAEAEEKQAVETREQRRARQNAEAEARREADRLAAQRLAAITLPDNPTREQCKAYITAIREHVGKRRSFSYRDAEVAKLQAVPQKHVDLLVREMAGAGKLHFYAMIALRGADLDAHQQEVIDQLEQHPKNIRYILQHGWFEKARPVIRKRLEAVDLSDDQAIEASWFHAFVEVAEPRHFKTLHGLAMKTRKMEEAVELLRTLPGYDADRTIRAMWESLDPDAKDNFTRRNRRELAVYAAEAGQVEALGALIQRLQKGPDFGVRLDEVVKPRLHTTRFIDFRGTDAEIKRWYDANKDKLEFDRLRQKFVLPDTD